MRVYAGRRAEKVRRAPGKRRRVVHNTVKGPANYCLSPGGGPRAPGAVSDDRNPPPRRALCDDGPFNISRIRVTFCRNRFFRVVPVIRRRRPTREILRAAVR